MGNFVILSILWRRDRVASENHNKKPLVIERRRGKERKKTPRLTKTYDSEIKTIQRPILLLPREQLLNMLIRNAPFLYALPARASTDNPVNFNV